MLLEKVIKLPGRENSGTTFLTELNKFSNSFYISSVILTKFGLPKTGDIVPYSKILRVRKFVRCADVRCKLL